MTRTAKKIQSKIELRPDGWERFPDHWGRADYRRAEGIAELMAAQASDRAII